MIEGLPAWAEVCAAIVAGVAAAGASWKTAKWLWAAFRFLMKLADDLSAFAEVLPTVVNIAHQFEKNNGSSLRDAIDRIEEKADAAANEARVVREMTEEQTKMLNGLPCANCPDKGEGK